MIRVLQLITGAKDVATARLGELLQAHSAGECSMTVRRIGPGLRYRNAAHAVACMRLGSEPEFDVVHARDTTALTAALGSAMPIIFSVPARPSRAEIRWLRLAARWRSIQIVMETDAQRKDLVTLGIPADRCRVVRPGIDLGCIASGRNEVLRQQLGFAPDEHVLLAPGRATHVWEHRRAVWSASILHVLDERQRIMLCGEGEQVAGNVELARRLRQPRLVVVTNQRLHRCVEFNELLSVADAALVAARGPVALSPMALCMAAGLPIVAAQSPWTTAILQDQQTALLVTGGAAREMARAVLRLRENPELASRLGSEARREAARLFEPVRYACQMREIYRQAAMTGSADRTSNAARPS